MGRESCNEGIAEIKRSEDNERAGDQAKLERMNMHMQFYLLAIGKPNLIYKKY